MTRNVKPTVIISQSGCFKFFNSLQWKSAAFFELLHDKMNFVYVDPHLRPSCKAEVVTNLHAQRMNIGEIIDEESTWTYEQAVKKVETYMEYFHPQHIVFINGNTNIYYLRDIEIYEDMFMDAKAHPTEPMTTYIPRYNHMHLHYFVQFMMLEWCAKHPEMNIQVHNIWEDPLQHKFDYIDGINLRHYYFHMLPNMVYPQPMGEKAFDKKAKAKALKEGKELGEVMREATTNTEVKNIAFEFCPSQEYWYAMVQNRGLLTKPIEKDIEFCFAMTDSWSQVDYRKNMILEMEDFADPEFFKHTGFFFHYTSKRTQLPWKWNEQIIEYDDYMELIKRSKFTLIIPSYDVNCFSLRRFFESVTNGCVPLILSDCNYKWGLNQGKEIVKFVEDNLLVDRQDVSKLPEIVKAKSPHYAELLEGLKQTQWWQTYSNPKFYMKSLKEMFSNIHEKAKVNKNTN